LPKAATRPLLRAMLGTFPSRDRLLVGRDISELDGFADQIKTAVISGIVLIFVLAGVASVLVTRRTVGRIESINATSRAIMQSGLDQRIPLRGTHDEWDRVAENLNQMLNRIETLMGEVRQVSDNVAHDLRTPLTRMRGRLEKAYHGQRSGEDDQALIGNTIADLDAVLRIFSSLTRIAQIETQARKGAFRTVNLAEIAGEVVELYDAAAEQVGTRLTVLGDREVLVTGDRDLIFDAIANLVDNAITGPEFPLTNTSRFSSASTGSNTAVTRRETGWGSAWSLPSPIFTARGSKCLIIRRVSSSNSGFPRRSVSRV
jgi:signal transduction histidine kinase